MWLTRRPYSVTFGEAPVIGTGPAEINPPEVEPAIHTDRQELMPEDIETTSHIVKRDEHTDDAAAALPNSRAWKFFADRINGTWRKAASDVISCGQTLIYAKDELPRNEFDVMLKSKLDFDASVARKLMCIAGSETLCAPGHKLPPRWTILYELSKLDNDLLKAKLADGSIHPGISRKGAIALLKPVADGDTDTGSDEAESPAEAKVEVPAEPETLFAHWERRPEERMEFLDRVTADGIQKSASKDFKRDLCASLPANPFMKLAEMEAAETATKILETVGTAKANLIVKSLRWKAHRKPKPG